jgi:hypothetical protein
MRWHRSFLAAVGQRLQQLGLRACPVCGRPDSLRVSPFPVLLTDDGPVTGAAAPAQAQEHFDDITAAVETECAACGHWMLFDSLKFRAGQERITLFEADEEEQGHPEE